MPDCSIHLAGRDAILLRVAVPWRAADYCPPVSPQGSCHFSLPLRTVLWHERAFGLSHDEILQAVVALSDHQLCEQYACIDVAV